MVFKLLNKLFNRPEDCKKIQYLMFPERDTKYPPPWWRTGFFRWRTWRCPEAGLAYLDWASTLTNTEWVDKDHLDYGKPTPQALSAMEIKELYTWWKEVYPNRPDPYDESGWTELCENRRSKLDDNDILGLLDSSDDTPEDKSATKLSLDSLHNIEAQYNQEDEDMMIRLIKVRQSLWT